MDKQLTRKLRKAADEISGVNKKMKSFREFLLNGVNN